MIATVLAQPADRPGPASRAMAPARRSARPAPAGRRRRRRARGLRVPARDARRDRSRASAGRPRARSPAGRSIPIWSPSSPRTAPAIAAPLIAAGAARAARPGSPCCRGSGRRRGRCCATARISTREVRQALARSAPSDFVLERRGAECRAADRPRRERLADPRAGRADRGLSAAAGRASGADAGARARGRAGRRLPLGDRHRRYPALGRRRAARAAGRPEHRLRSPGRGQYGVDGQAAGALREARAVPRRPLLASPATARPPATGGFRACPSSIRHAAASSAIAAPPAGRGPTRSPAPPPRPSRACSAPSSRPIRCAS